MIESHEAARVQAPYRATRLSAAAHERRAVDEGQRAMATGATLPTEVPQSNRVMSAACG